MLKLSTWYQRFQHRLDHAWFVPLMAVIAVANAFLPFLPVEIFVILRVLIRPREWWRTPVLIAAASAAGAVILAVVVGSDSHSPIANFLASHLGQANWDRAAGIVRERGAWGLALISISFIPQQPAVVVAALSRMPLWQIALPIWIARSVKYLVYSAIAAFAPHWILAAEHHAEIKKNHYKDSPKP